MGLRLHLCAQPLGMQSKLLRRSEEALRTCRRERSDRSLRIAEIPDQLKEFNERDVFEG